MNIRDIAKLAGVSITTVSKVVNNKDQGINPETRKRILDIVKEYNYTPYSSVKQNWAAKTFLIGFISNGSPGMQSILRGVTDSVQERNYSVIACENHGEDQQLKSISRLLRHNVDGVIYDRITDLSFYEKQFKDKIPQLAIEGTGIAEPDGYGVDYVRAGFLATQKLIQYGHRRIALFLPANESISQAIIKGHRQCLFANGVIWDEKLLMNPRKLDKQIFLDSFTGALCMDEKTAAALYRLTWVNNIKIPESLSVVSFCDDRNIENSTERLSLLMIPYYNYGRYLGKEMIGRIEKTEHTQPDYQWEFPLNGGYSIDIPVSSRSKNILVVGSVHTDLFINISEFPQVGRTVSAQSCFSYSGGKGMNQAIGAAKLGAGVCLISKIGKDYDGTFAVSILNDNKVNIQGVSIDSKVDTGKAFVCVQEDGDSSIINYDGANRNLSVSDIENNEILFQDAGFCLLPLEIPLETAEFAAETARRHGVKTILKPSAIRRAGDRLFKNIDFFVPNEKEADILCTKYRTPEDKALYFLDKGVETVIITLGARGCYLKNQSFDRYFDADNFVTLDTTGAADAFIAALAVYLTEKYALDEAILYAVSAAGFCVSRQGTLNAMVDRTTLDLYMSKKRVPDADGK